LEQRFAESSQNLFYAARGARICAMVFFALGVLVTGIFWLLGILDSALSFPFLSFTIATLLLLYSQGAFFAGKIASKMRESQVVVVKNSLKTTRRIVVWRPRRGAARTRRSASRALASAAESGEDGPCSDPDADLGFTFSESIFLPELTFLFKNPNLKQKFVFLSVGGCSS
jgi:hypothetical protein